MKKRVILILIGIVGYGMAVWGQVAPDSIAVCPPGEPGEMIIVAPEDVVVQEAEDVPEATGGSRLMTAEEIAEARDTIMANYDSAWSELSMQGKLTFDGLPMAVSVKVYMKRGESIILSARAPFFGEVARVEVCQDSITLINKHTRCYNTQPLSGLMVDRQAYLNDLQDILLGQVAFPGHGRMTADNALLSQWIALATSEVLLYPGQSLQTPGTEYGFVLDSDGWELRSFVLMLQKTGTVLETKYEYGEQGWTLGIEISLPKKKMKGEVVLTYPDYEPGSAIQFTQLGGKYRKVDFKQLLKF